MPAGTAPRKSSDIAAERVDRAARESDLREPMACAELRPLRAEPAANALPAGLRDGDATEGVAGASQLEASSRQLVEVEVAGLRDEPRLVVCGLHPQAAVAHVLLDGDGHEVLALREPLRRARRRAAARGPRAASRRLRPSCGEPSQISRPRWAVIRGSRRAGRVFCGSPALGIRHGHPRLRVCLLGIHVAIAPRHVAGAGEIEGDLPEGHQREPGHLRGDVGSALAVEQPVRDAPGQAQRREEHHRVRAVLQVDHACVAPRPWVSAKPSSDANRTRAPQE